METNEILELILGRLDKLEKKIDSFESKKSITVPTLSITHSYHEVDGCVQVTSWNIDTVFQTPGRDTIPGFFIIEGDETKCLLVALYRGLNQALFTSQKADELQILIDSSSFVNWFNYFSANLDSTEMMLDIHYEKFIRLVQVLDNNFDWEMIAI